jgi:hypothetical protein
MCPATVSEQKCGPDMGPVTCTTKYSLSCDSPSLQQCQAVAASLRSSLDAVLARYQADTSDPSLRDLENRLASRATSLLDEQRSLSNAVAAAERDLVEARSSKQKTATLLATANKDLNTVTTKLERTRKGLDAVASVRDALSCHRSAIGALIDRREAQPPAAPVALEELEEDRVHLARACTPRRPTPPPTAGAGDPRACAEYLTPPLSPEPPPLDESVRRLYTALGAAFTAAGPTCKALRDRTAQRSSDAQAGKFPSHVELIGDLPELRALLFPAAPPAAGSLSAQEQVLDALSKASGDQEHALSLLVPQHEEAVREQTRAQQDAAAATSAVVVRENTLTQLRDKQARVDMELRTVNEDLAVTRSAHDTLAAPQRCTTKHCTCRVKSQKCEQCPSPPFKNKD